MPQAQKTIASLKREQARGSFQTAKFYEHYKRWNGALVYYNQVLLDRPQFTLMRLRLVSDWMN